MLTWPGFLCPSSDSSEPVQLITPDNLTPLCCAEEKKKISTFTESIKAIKSEMIELPKRDEPPHPQGGASTVKRKYLYKSFLSDCPNRWFPSQSLQGQCEAKNNNQQVHPDQFHRRKEFNLWAHQWTPGPPDLLLMLISVCVDDDVLATNTLPLLSQIFVFANCRILWFNEWETICFTMKGKWVPFVLQANSPLCEISSCCTIVNYGRRNCGLIHKSTPKQGITKIVWLKIEV